MKSITSFFKNRLSEIPIHRRVKYTVLSTVSLIALVAITIVAAIDMNKEEKVIDTSDPIESYDTVIVIPLEFEDEPEEVTDDFSDPGIADDFSDRGVTDGVSDSETADGASGGGN